MVRSKPHPPRNRASPGGGQQHEGGETIHDFLARELPPGKTKLAPYLTEALLKAGARYDRYAAESNRKKWLDYSARAKRLGLITKLSEKLASDLCELDILTRDQLETRIDAKAIEELVGSLHLLRRQTADLGKEVQKTGRPRDLAEQLWITELADIYENNFNEVPSAWKSDTGPMSKFYRFLELSRPEQFAMNSKLDRRQIDRILQHHRQKKSNLPATD
jgi:hypothetical protein